jgi:Uma2 family endonuclease
MTGQEIATATMPTTEFYPSSDGEPIAETDTHAKLLINLRLMLEEHFAAQANVYVSGNLFIYYVAGNPKKRVAPDVFVVHGVPKGARRIYKLWEEGQPPSVVIELSSRKTWREDWQEKFQLYAQLGVKEYYIFDPEYDYLPEPLIASRLVEGAYEPVEVVDGRVHSEALSLDLVDDGRTLRLYDPQRKTYLLTAAEALRQVEEMRVELARLQSVREAAK